MEQISDGKATSGIKNSEARALCFPFPRDSETPPSFLPSTTSTFSLPPSFRLPPSRPSFSFGFMASSRSYLHTIQSDVSLDWEPVTSPKSPSSPLSPGSDGTGRINAGAFWKSRNSQGEGMEKVSLLGVTRTAFCRWEVKE